MQKSALYLHRAAIAVGAEVPCLLLISYQRRAAIGTMSREESFPNILRALLQRHSCYLWNNLATLLYIYIVAYVEVQQRHLLRIVQGGAFYCCSRELYRLQIGNGCYCACSAHLVIYAKEFCAGLFRLELPGCGPPWRLCRKAQKLLLLQAVYLYYYAVCGEGEALAPCVPFLYIFYCLIYCGAELAVGGDRQAPTFGGLQRLPLCCHIVAWRYEVVEYALQPAVCHLFGVLQFKRACRCVSGVGEERVALLFPIAVKGLEGFEGHIYLSSYLKVCRIVTSQLLRNGGYLPHILRYIVAHRAVSSCEGSLQLALFVGEADCRAVKFEFAGVLQRLLYAFEDALVEGV